MFHSTLSDEFRMLPRMSSLDRTTVPPSPWDGDQQPLARTGTRTLNVPVMTGRRMLRKTGKKQCMQTHCNAFLAEPCSRCANVHVHGSCIRGPGEPRCPSNDRWFVFSWLLQDRCMFIDS